MHAQLRPLTHPWNGPTARLAVLVAAPLLLVACKQLEREAPPAAKPKAASEVPKKLPAARETKTPEKTRIPDQRAKPRFAVPGVKPGVYTTIPIKWRKLTVTDDALKRELRRKIAFHPQVQGGRVEVDVQESVVTLRGEVPHMQARDSVLRAVEQTRGVRSVVDQMKVEPVKRPNMGLKLAIQEALKEDAVTAGANVAVAVLGGKVTLTGQVQSRQLLEAVMTAVKGVRGVAEIENRLEVVYPEQVSDGDIRRKIAARLLWDNRVRSDAIDISINQGVVTLAGIVGSLFEKRMASQIAWIPGVKRVDAAKLEVKPFVPESRRAQKAVKPPTDENVKGAIVDAYLYDPRLKSFEPEVYVDGGVVTLMGKVSNLEAYRAAEQDAKNTVGVVRVRNLLLIRSNDRLTDDQLERAVQKALERDPVLSPQEMRTSVENGIARVSGAVPSMFDKKRVQEVVSGVQGIQGIRNSLVVAPTLHQKEDWEIADDLRQELFWSPYVSEEDIQFKVQEGVVVLEGKVGSWRERREAAAAARRAGAWRVRNQLERSPG